MVVDDTGAAVELFFGEKVWCQRNGKQRSELQPTARNSAKLNSAQLGMALNGSGNYVF
jgi:hypothetical protein